MLTGSIVRETGRSDGCYWSPPRSTLQREVLPSWISSLSSRLFSRPLLLHFIQFWVRPGLRGSEVLHNTVIHPSQTEQDEGELLLVDRMRILFVCFQLCWKFICTTCIDSVLAYFPNTNCCINLIYNLNIEEEKNTTCFWYKFSTVIRFQHQASLLRNHKCIKLYWNIVKMLFQSVAV